MQFNLSDFLLLPIKILLTVLSTLTEETYRAFTSFNRKMAGIDFMERFNQFPVYESSQQEYLEVRKKIEVFTSMILNLQEAELTLTGNDLNSLRVVRGEIDGKSKTINKTPEFYEVSNDGVLEKRFLAPFPTRYGFLDRTMLIYYQRKDDIWIERRQIIENYGKTLDQLKQPSGQFYLNQSLVLFLILTANRSPEERNKFIGLVSKIQEISISNGILSIKA
jgi:hypothetical protein